MKVRSGAAALIAGAAGLVGAAAVGAQQFVPPPVDAHFAPNPQPMAFDLFRGNRIFFEGTVNGHPAQFMLDSGAAMSVVDRGFADRIGLQGTATADARGTGGSVAAKIASGVTISAGPLTLRNANALLLDFKAISQAIGKRIDVVLGRDAFDAGIVDIDFATHRIRFMPAEKFVAPTGAIPVPMTAVHGVRRIPVSIGDRAPIMADLDLGHGGALMVSAPAWQGDQALSAMRYGHGRAGGVGGFSERRLVTLPSVTVGGVRFDNVPAAFNTVASDLPVTGANIGLDMLQRFHLSIDYGHGTLYLTPTADTHRPLPKDRLGLGTELAGDRLKVMFVSPDGPAAAAGWKQGDEVIAVGGVKVGPDFYGSRYGAMGRMPAGMQLDLVRADGTHLPVVLADFF